MIRSLVALVVAIVAVHLAYIGYIRPEAQLAIEAARAAGQSAPRDFVVIVRDYEQEICVILMIWGIYLIAVKCIEILNDRYLFKVDLLEGAGSTGEAAGVSGDLLAVLNSLEELPGKIRESPLVKTLTSSLRRYLITGDVHNTSDAIEASVEALAVKQEAENSMIRYLIWAIPSIGFIGTVRGIGQALSQADQALAGDISAMTESLGIAFNSTFVALLISIGLMFLLHQLQRLQDGLVVDTQGYCESFLLKRLSALGLSRLNGEGRN
jgi:biopolymer transport protein ExbB/TolQ